MRSRAKFVLLFLLVLTLFVIPTANVVTSNILLSRILTVVEKSESIMDEYVRELPRIDQVNYPWQDVRNITSRSRTELEVQLSILEASGSQWFGREFNPSISAFSLHVIEWIQLYEIIEGCREYQCYVEALTAPNSISSSFEISRVRFQESVPWIDFLGARKRIDKVFKD